MGFMSTLTLIFIVLKLVGVIDWSWWLVFMPVYGTWIVGGGTAGLIYLLKR